MALPKRQQPHQCGAAKLQLQLPQRATCSVQRTTCDVRQAASKLSALWITFKFECEINALSKRLANRLPLATLPKSCAACCQWFMQQHLMKYNTKGAQQPQLSVQQQQQQNDYKNKDKLPPMQIVNYIRLKCKVVACFFPFYIRRRLATPAHAATFVLQQQLLQVPASSQQHVSKYYCSHSSWHAAISNAHINKL